MAPVQQLLRLGGTAMPEGKHGGREAKEGKEAAAAAAYEPTPEEQKEAFVAAAALTREWLHVINVACEYQQLKPQIPPDTKPTEVPLAEIAYWESK